MKTFCVIEDNDSDYLLSEIALRDYFPGCELYRASRESNEITRGKVKAALAGGALTALIAWAMPWINDLLNYIAPKH